MGPFCRKNLYSEVIIAFSYLCMLEKVLYGVKFFEKEILMDLDTFKVPESENHIFSC